MSHINVEIKAKCANAEKIKKILKDSNADFKGVDHQIDTYFNVCQNGRLKLRQGNIENSLIHYNRPDQSGPKRSDVTMLRIDSEHGSTLKQVLTASNGVKVVVDKTREICFVENVKFHIDEVKQLGAFVEIEAIDENGSIGEEKLLQQCKHWLKKLEIDDKSLIEQSYSDLILEKEKKEED